MPVYTSPSTQSVADSTGANMDALGLDAGELDTLLGELTVKAEADLALEISEGKWDSDQLTEREVITMQEAVCYGVVARFLRRCAAEKADGSHEPHIIEASQEMIARAAEFDAKALELVSRIAVGPGEQVARIQNSWTGRTPTFTRDGANW